MDGVSDNEATEAAETFDIATKQATAPQQGSNVFVVRKLTAIITQALAKSGQVFTTAELCAACDTLKQVAQDISK